MYMSSYTVFGVNKQKPGKDVWKRKVENEKSEDA